MTRQNISAARVRQTPETTHFLEIRKTRTERNGWRMAIPSYKIVMLMYMERKNGTCGRNEKGLAAPDTLYGKFAPEFAESVNCIFTGGVLNLS